MEDEDYLALIALLEQQLVDIGAAELADPSLYLIHREEGAEGYLPEPRKRLVEMLYALDRYFAIRDRETYARALSGINERLVEGRIESVLVLPAEGDDRRNPFSLEQAPALGELRERLSRLADQLLEAGPDGRRRL